MIDDLHGTSSQAAFTLDSEGIFRGQSSIFGNVRYSVDDIYATLSNRRLKWDSASVSLHPPPPPQKKKKKKKKKSLK